jgi:hypothetical protein
MGVGIRSGSTLLRAAGSKFELLENEEAAQKNSSQSLNRVAKSRLKRLHHLFTTPPIKIG